MIQILLHFILISSVPVHAKDAKTVRAMSNIENSHVTLMVESASGQMSLRDLSLETLKAVVEPTLPDLGQEEVMGLFRGKEGLILLSQWTAGDGKFPTIRFWNKKSKQWKSYGKLPCVSFDTVEIDAEKMTVQCEEDANRKTNEGPVSLSLAGVFWHMKTVLPRREEKMGSLTIKLDGPMFHWTRAHIKTGKKTKTLDFQDLTD